MSASIILVPFLCCSIILSAASAPLGILTTVGSIRVDGADVRGNGTVLNGSVVETANNPSQLIFKSGGRLDLAAQSRAQFYENHLNLERGASQIHASNGYSIRVNSLSIIPLGPSTIRVFRASASKLQVSAVTGQAEVQTANGSMIARVVAGSSLDFEQPPAGAAGATQISGNLEKQAGHYILTDVTTKTTLELQGDNLEKSVGQCITGSGSPDPSTATLIHLATYDRVSCKKLGIPGLEATGTFKGGVGVGNAVAPGAAAGGLSTGVLTSIVVGGAAAGGLGGAAAAGVFTGGKATPVSAP